jgi:hypothetical protein
MVTVQRPGGETVMSEITVLRYLVVLLIGFILGVFLTLSHK